MFSRRSTPGQGEDIPPRAERSFLLDLSLPEASRGRRVADADHTALGTGAEKRTALVLGRSVSAKRFGEWRKYCSLALSFY
jgi:hypothetical protein